MPEKLTNAALIGGGTASVVPDIVNKSAPLCQQIANSPTTIFQYPIYASETIIFVPQDIVTALGVIAVVVGMIRALKSIRSRNIAD